LSDKLRIDAKYFGKAVNHARHLVERKLPVKLGEITSVLRKGIFDIKADTYAEADEGVPFIRISDLGNGIIDEDSTARITEEAHRREIATALQVGDLAISKTGFPAAALITTPVCNVSQDIIATKLSSAGKKRIIPQYALIYLLSRFGLEIMGAEFQGNVQEHLGLSDAKMFPIPSLNRDFQLRIKKAFESALKLTGRAKARLSEAETQLAVNVGLGDWSPPEPLAYTANSASAVAAARLDAQYFMPAKAEVLRSLSSLPGQLLSERADSVRDQWLPDAVDPATLVRNYDVTDALVPILDAEKEPSPAEDIGSMKKVLQDGDVAMSRLRAYLKEIAVVRKADDILSVGSSEFIVLRPKNACISAETLMVFLRSAPVQTILKWCQDGSQHPRFSESDLLAIPVPDAVLQASTKVTALVLKGFAARQQAAALLDAAKRAVEIAIEQDEAAALRFLDAAQA
jgi:type I restriction enzyme, S subunit